MEALELLRHLDVVLLGLIELTSLRAGIEPTVGGERRSLASYSFLVPWQGCCSGSGSGSGRGSG